MFRNPAAAQGMVCRAGRSPALRLRGCAAADAPHTAALLTDALNGTTSAQTCGQFNTTPKKKKRIVILSGGFAGVKCAQTLSRALSRDDAEIVLFNAENHFVFTPLLADVIGASVNPLDVVVPLRQLLSGVSCRTEEVLSLDIATSEVEYRSSDGQTCRLHYDHLVLACGNVANLHAVPGMADHAFPLKNIGDAVALRSHVMEQMEKAETCSDVQRRRWYLSFIVVGAGYSGVEAAGEINDLIRGSARYFQNFRAEDVTVTVIHSRDQILPEIGRRLREFARRKMEQAGVKILLNSRVASATAEGVALEGGEFVHGGTVVCTVGSSPAPILERLAAPKEKGRLLTEADMRVRGTTNVWATGDCAQIVNAYDNLPAPPTGQFAERQAEGQVLEGVVTMTDWMRALSRGAGPDTPVSELVVHHPIMLSIEDDGAVAATVVREHRLKNLPVVKCRGHRQLVGCLRTRRLMAHVFNRVGKPALSQT